MHNPLALLGPVVCTLALGLFNGQGEIILWEPFDYPDGALVDQAAGKWIHHSGTQGDMPVHNGRLLLKQSNSEDIHAQLEGQPYLPTGPDVLFARFKLSVTELPKAANGGYFAHFKDTGNGFRGRVFVTTNSAGPGSFRVGIAGTNVVPSALYPLDLNPATDYTIIVRLVVSDATSTLWVDPQAESDTSVAAADSGSPVSVSAFAFRQATGIGSLAVDELAVGKSFDEVLTATNPPAMNAPVITRQPESQTITVGADITFSLAAAGSAPLRYQLQFNGIDLPDATNATLTLSSVSTNQAGAYSVTVSNLAGSITSDPAILTVTETPLHSNLLLKEGFDYADGPLTGVSGGIWTNHSGVELQTQVRNGKLALNQADSEDVNALLAGQPFTPADGHTLYAHFTASFSELPTGPNGAYFAHFKDKSNGYRCRIFATTNGAMSGCFRLGLANAASTTTDLWSSDLNLNTPYTIVTRMDVGSGVSALWINPNSETDVSVSASDPATPITVAAFAFRQSLSSGNGMGVLTVDDLLIATSWEGVFPDQPPIQPISGLSISCLADQSIQIRWQADPARTYTLWRTSQLDQAWVIYREGLSFSDDQGQFLDDEFAISARYFYRISSP